MILGKSLTLYGIYSPPLWSRGWHWWSLRSSGSKIISFILQGGFWRRYLTDQGLKNSDCKTLPLLELSHYYLYFTCQFKKTSFWVICPLPLLLAEETKYSSAQSCRSVFTVSFKILKPLLNQASKSTSTWVHSNLITLPNRPLASCSFSLLLSNGPLLA